MESRHHTDDRANRLEEELAVVDWRTSRLRALGYGVRDAALLALSPVDVHDLERLIARGCPPETAVRIAA